jgi:phenylpyruvate tautomerase PptA (4-oxalocrotonate tautomerase family)
MHGKIVQVKICGGQQEEKPKDRLIDIVTRDAREVLGTA